MRGERSRSGVAVVGPVVGLVCGLVLTGCGKVDEDRLPEVRPQLERQQAAVKERTLELGPALAEELGATLLSSRGGWQGNWHQMGASTCAYDSGTTMRMPATATKPYYPAVLEALRALDLAPKVHVAVDGTGSAAADDGSLDVGVGETADARWQYLNLSVRGESVDVPDSLAGDDCLGPQTDDWTDEVTP